MRCKRLSTSRSTHNAYDYSRGPIHLTRWVVMGDHRHKQINNTLSPSRALMVNPAHLQVLLANARNPIGNAYTIPLSS
ncbi:MAG: hypothetical protein ACI8VC_002157 [Candidatus Endobugula sp.]|jgi:hypothetical protein